MPRTLGFAFIRSSGCNKQFNKNRQMRPWIGGEKTFDYQERDCTNIIYSLPSIYEISKMKVAYKNLTKGGGNKENEFTLTFGER